MLCGNGKRVRRVGEDLRVGMFGSRRVMSLFDLTRRDVEDVTGLALARKIQSDRLNW